MAPLRLRLDPRPQRVADLALDVAVAVAGPRAAELRAEGGEVVEHGADPQRPIRRVGGADGAQPLVRLVVVRDRVLAQSLERVLAVQRALGLEAELLQALDDDVAPRHGGDVLADRLVAGQRHGRPDVADHVGPIALAAALVVSAADARRPP